MFDPVVIVLECAAGIVRRVDEDALDLACEFLFEGFEGEEIVAEDEAVVENIAIIDTLCRMIRLDRVFE